MSAATAMAMIAVVAVATYVMRAGMIVLLSGVELPDSLARALRYVGPAVLAALAMNLAFGGKGGPDVDLAEVAGLAVGAATMLWRRNLVLAVLAGMAAFWILL